MDTGLEGRTALVTGASGAIGHAIARGLATEGAAVAVTWHTNQQAAADLVDTIKDQGGQAHAVRLDQSDPTDARRVLDEAGPVTVLVANAVQWPPFDGDQITDLAASLTANVVGPAALIDAALPAMRAAGWGRIVIVSTDIVEQPLAGPLAYPTAKGAMETAARVLAVREARHGILTNVVRPGFALTDRARAMANGVASESAKTPTGRICTPEDVASAVTYLASAANGHVNGQALSVAGGRELMR